MTLPPKSPLPKSPPPRYAENLPLPPYSYVTGKFPHPVSDPVGHSFGHPPEKAPRPQSEAWRESTVYCFGIDLFNHGYYWEAHEAWEALWHACERKPPEADFFKCLIKLAAAGVKAREGRLNGVTRHLARAIELLELLRVQLPPDATRYFGLSLDELALHLTSAQPAIDSTSLAELTDPAAVKIVFPFQLRPE